jgi:hypothetical protein
VNSFHENSGRPDAQAAALVALWRNASSSPGPQAAFDMASAALTESFTLLPFKPSTACIWRFELPSRPPPGRRSGSRGIVLSLGILVSAKRSVSRKGSKGDCGAPAKVRSIVQETDFQPDGKSDPWRTKQQGRFVAAASDEEDMPLTAVDEACRRPGGRGGLFATSIRWRSRH